MTEHGTVTGSTKDPRASSSPWVGKDAPVRVLYVDPDAVQLRHFHHTLAVDDCVVRTAERGTDGLRLLDDLAYAVVLCDAVLPDMGGIEFLARASRIRPDAARMLVIEHLDVETIVEAVNKIGVVAVIPKPWEGSYLRTAVRRGIVQHRMQTDAHLMVVRLNDMNERLHALNRELDGRVAERTAHLFLSLCNALDLRDTDTQWHSRRVALYARRLAIEMGIAGEEVVDIERGALLHDIGKIGVSDTILLKPGRLTEDEWVTMRRHADLGAQILDGILFLERARLVVQQHHERWDGGGYSQRLQGPGIYVGARIFAVIDAYDAITSDRPYRRALGHAEALAEIRAGRGTQFDPDVVDAFSRIPEADLSFIRERSSDPEAAD